jgi:DNA-binding SARP family transcriptional activator
MLKITLLGQFLVEKEGQSIEIASRPAQSLLAFLALSAGTKHQRAKLAGFFWPDSTESNALSNLRHTLWRLRKAIGSEYLLTGNQVIAFDQQADHWLDAAILDQRLPEDTSVDDLIASVSAYRGEFLPGYYDDWVILERERLQGVFERNMKRLLDRLVDQQRWDDVLLWAERWIAFGQAPEPAYRALMVAHSGLGDISGVEGVFQRCVAVLDQELGVEPSAETRDLYEQLMRGEKPSKAPFVADFQHVPPEIFPAESPAFLDAKAVPLVDEKGAFVGRERELAHLDELLRKAIEGKGQLVFLIGEAGQGKTSLLYEFARRAQAAHADLVVAAGACDAYAGIGDAYLPFRDAMNMLTGDVENQWSAGIISRDHAQRLWRLLPTMVEAIVDQDPSLLGTFVSAEALTTRIAIYETSEGGRLEHLNEILARPARAGEKSWDQNRLFEAYTEVLKKLARHHPLVLILDDLHWADVSSISLLFHLARRSRESRIFIVGAYRPEDVVLGRAAKEHPLEGVLGEFKRHFGEIWVDLDQGEQASGREFVDALLDTEPNQLGEGFRKDLAFHTRGHPLFTVELLRDMQERGDLVHDEKGRWEVAPKISWDAMPARVEGIIQKRMGRLDSDLLEMLTVASVEGVAFTAEVVARVLGIEEQALVRRLSSELYKRHRLVRATGIERLGTQRLSRYRFRHNLFQGYLYNSLDEVERAYRHEAVGNELEELYAQQEERIAGIAGQLARHFHEAGDEKRALKYYTQAGDRAARMYAYEEARQFLQKALKLSEADESLLEQHREWRQMDYCPFAPQDRRDVEFDKFDE